MCKNKLLVSKTYGYVSKCLKCNCFQIAFGTTVFTISTKRFPEFLQRLYVLRREGDNYGLHERKIVVDLDVQTIKMCLTPNELEHLIENIETAYMKNLVFERIQFQN